MAVIRYVDDRKVKIFSVHGVWCLGGCAGGVRWVRWGWRSVDIGLVLLGSWSIWHGLGCIGSCVVMMGR
jgi:hypothetical protein